MDIDEEATVENENRISGACRYCTYHSHTDHTVVLQPQNESMFRSLHIGCARARMYLVECHIAAAAAVIQVQHAFAIVKLMYCEIINPSSEVCNNRDFVC